MSESKGRLTVTIKVGESVFIGPDVTVSVAGAEGKQVKLCIAAPKHIQIQRQKFDLKRLRRERGDSLSNDGA